MDIIYTGGAYLCVFYLLRIMPLVFLILLFLLVPSLADERRHQLYSAAYNTPGEVELVHKLIAGDGDPDGLKVWILEETMRRNDVSSWWTLALFYQRTGDWKLAESSLGKVLALDDKNEDLRVERVKVRIQRRLVSKALADLDVLDKNSPETVERKLLRATALYQSGKSWEARERCLEAARSITERTRAEEIEAIYAKMYEINSRSEAKDFLLKNGSGFEDDWRFQFLLASILDDEGREGESREIYWSLLTAEGEVGKRFHVRDTSRFRPVASWLPDELRPVGWLDRVIPASRLGGLRVFWSGESTALPQSAMEARLMSFGKLVRRGENPEFVGLEYPSLLAALFRADGSFEKVASQMIENRPNDLKLRAAFLSWANFSLSQEKLSDDLLWDSIKLVGVEHPALAIRAVRGFVERGAINQREGISFVTALLEGRVGIEEINAAAAFAFGLDDRNRRFGPDISERGLRDVLLTWALTEHGEVEPVWLWNLSQHLLREERVSEVIALVNRYSREGMRRGSSGRPAWDLDLDSIMRNYEQAEWSSSLKMKGVIPVVFRGKVPRLVEDLLERLKKDDERTEISEKLDPFYPQMNEVIFSPDDLRAHLALVDDVAVRCLLASLVEGEDLDWSVEELSASVDVSDRVILSWVEEDGGNVEKAYEMLLSIDQDDLTEREKIGLDRRVVTLGALKVRRVSESWKIEAARSAWTRLLAKDDRQDFHYLTKLAPLLGMEGALPARSTPRKPPVDPLDVIKVVKDFVLRQQLDEAVASAAQSLRSSDRWVRESLCDYLKEQKLMTQVLARMRGESEGNRQLLEVAALAREFGDETLAEECYGKVLASDAMSFDAHLGLNTLNEADFGGMIEALPMARIEEGVRLWQMRESRSHLTNVREEIVLLGLIEELLEREKIGESDSKVAKFVARWEISASRLISSGQGQRQAGGFEGAGELVRKKERAIALAMLDHGHLAGIGFSKLHANQKKWELKDEELVRLAMQGFRAGLLMPEPAPVGALPWFLSSSGKKLWTAEEYLRKKGRLREALDEATMTSMRGSWPSMARSMELAKRIALADTEDALKEWEEELPEKGHFRRRAVLEMLDNVIVFGSESNSGIDVLEKLWLKTLAEDSRIWTSERELIDRWLKWRLAQDEQIVGDFVERVLVSILGPKEAWPLIGEQVEKKQFLPGEIHRRMRDANLILPIIFREDAVRKKVLSLIFQDGLLEIFGWRRVLWLFERRELADFGEEMIHYQAGLLRDLSEESLALGGKQVAKLGLFLIQSIDQGSLKKVATKPQVKDALQGPAWHPQLRPWVGLLTTRDKNEKFELLDEFLAEKTLLKEMVAIDQKMLRGLLKSHFGSDFEEAGLKVDAVLGAEVEEGEIALAQLIDGWAKGEVQIGRDDNVGHTMWKSIFEYAKIDPTKAGVAAGAVMEAALKDINQRKFESFSGYYFTSIFSEARLSLDQEIRLLSATYQSGVRENLPIPRDLDSRLGYFLWGSIRGEYPGVQRGRGLRGDIFGEVLLDAAASMNLAEQTLLLAGILPKLFSDLVLEDGEGELLLTWIEESLRGESELLADAFKSVLLEKLGRAEERRSVFLRFLNQLEGPTPVLLDVMIGLVSEDRGNAFCDDRKVWMWVGPLLKEYRNGLRSVRARSGILSILSALSKVEMEGHSAQVTRLSGLLGGNLLSPEGVAELDGYRTSYSLRMIVGFLNAGDNTALLERVVRDHHEKLRGDLWTLTRLLSKGRTELAALLVQPNGERYHLDEGLRLEDGVEAGLLKLAVKLPQQEMFHLEVVVAGLQGEGRERRLRKLVVRYAKECPEGYRAKWQVLGSFAREKELGADLDEEYLKVAEGFTLEKAVYIDDDLRASDSAKELLGIIHRAIANDLLAGKSAWAIKEVRALAASEEEAYSDYLSKEARVVLEELLPHLLSKGEEGLAPLRLLLADAFYLRSHEDLPLVFWSAKLAHRRAGEEIIFEKAVKGLGLSEEKIGDLEWCLREQGKKYGKERIEALGGWTDDQKSLKGAILDLFKEDAE